jgi:DNA-binding response OmpR family regulator
VSRESLRALGADDVFRKPVNPGELLAAVGRYC